MNISLSMTISPALDHQHSWQTALTKMVDNWFTTMNNSEVVGAVL